MNLTDNIEWKKLGEKEYILLIHSYKLQTYLIYGDESE